VPTSGAGVYSVWDERGQLVYVGAAGRNPQGAGLAGRLRSHASGRRSGDEFCVYVADHYVLPELTPEQVEAIAGSQLSMDDLFAKRSTDPSRSGSQRCPTTPRHSPWRAG
jgi:hypothetical protein